MKVSFLASVVLLLLAHSALFSQSSDFLVLSSGDTLRGEVTHLDRQGASIKKVKLTNYTGKQKRYPRHAILAFRAGKKTYEGFWLSQSSEKVLLLNPKYTIDVQNGEQIFLQVVSKGPLSHYRWEWQEQGESLIQTMDLLKKEDDQFLVRADQGLLGLKRKAVANYLSDCQVIVSSLAQKQLKSVSEVVTLYNDSCAK